MNRPLYLAAGVVCLALAGCGSKVGASRGATPTPKPTRTPAPTINAVVVTPTETAVATATPRPTARPTRPTSAPTTIAVTGPSKPVVVSASLTPDPADARGRLQATVITQGAVTGVKLYLGTVGAQAPAPMTYQLALTSTGRWAASGAAPSYPAEYTYSVGLFDSRGSRTVISAQSWTLQVTGNSSPAQSLPADIPLAPPFNYGNPVAATFSAEGQSVNGSEVVSNQRTDVASATVAQFYEKFLPRSGWAVDAGTIPASGSSAWTLAATKAGRVVAVQFTSGIVHIFYGAT